MTGMDASAVRAVPRPVRPTRVRHLSTVMRVLVAAFLAAIGAGLIVPQLASLVGYEMHAARNGAMAPAISVGALVVVERSAPEAVRVGDVVGIRLDNQAVVARRVNRVVEHLGIRYFETKADANEAVDPSTVRGERLIGVVRHSVPYVGWLLAILSLPIGIAALLSLGCTSLTALLLLDEGREGIDGTHARAARAAGLAGRRAPLGRPVAGLHGAARHRRATQ